jgi:hypothetical protein
MRGFLGLRPRRFSLRTQDEITARIQNAIGDTVVKTEAVRASRTGQVDLQAWQPRMQAWEGFHRWDRQGCLNNGNY